VSFGRAGAIHAGALAELLAADDDDDDDRGGDDKDADDKDDDDDRDGEDDGGLWTAKLGAGRLSRKGDQAAPPAPPERAHPEEPCRRPQRVVSSWSCLPVLRDLDLSFTAATDAVAAPLAAALAHPSAALRVLNLAGAERSKRREG
jgi:hypothetical protein